MKRSSEPIFDVSKAKSLIERGRRTRWWRRIGKTTRGFRYLDAHGQQIKNPLDLQRISSLVIPPAWKHVRINPSPGGKIQVVGMDKLGRVQYRYDAAFSAKQQKAKFAKIESFGELLPKLRRMTNEHILLEGLPREKVLAVVIRLINSLYFRVGTDLSAVHYKTYGITTLQKRHLTIGKKGKLSFEFTGKSHVQHRKVIVDEELAAVVKELSEIKKGKKLFRYSAPDGKIRAVTPSQINAYLKSAVGREYSAKDFRTWGATVLAASLLAEIGEVGDAGERKRTIVRVIKKVAEELGNTPAVCRSSYVHPTVLDAYISGLTIQEFRSRKTVRRIADELEPEERALMKLFSTVNGVGKRT